ncbi:BolA/IbaG family iron-sulfur metabolism protein [bacterium]|nr:BolA/IbaG family iron-sulfur metabolism protein [bacterium]
MTSLTDGIRDLIIAAIPDAEVIVEDPYNDSTHFQAAVISSRFDGMSLVKQHQLVLNALKAEMEANIVHALALKTYTPNAWKSQSGK